MNTVPCSRDVRWRDWARPLAALLRSAPHSRVECIRFGVATGVHLALATNLLPWLENEALARVSAGLATLTPLGASWVGDYRTPVRLPPAPPAPTYTTRAADLRDVKLPGRLKPIERAGRDAYGALWLCACACGNPALVLCAARHLRSGHTRSCGCIVRELREENRGLTFSQWRAA